MRAMKLMAIRRCRAVLTFLVPIIACTRYTRAETVDIRPKWEQGQSRYIELHQKVNQDMGAMKIGSESTYGMIQKVIKAGADGVTLELTLDRAKSFSDMMDSTYDSDDSDNPESAPQMRDTFKAILGKSMRVELDADGKFKKVSGADEIQKALDTEVQANNLFAMNLQSREFSEQRLRLAWGEIPASLFPGKPVSVGDTWDRTIADDIPRIGKTETIFHYRLDKVEDAAGHKIAWIDVDAQIKMVNDDKDEDGGPKISGKFKGRAKFDFAEGAITEKTQEGSINIEIVQPTMKIAMKSSATSKMRPVSEREREKADAAKASKGKHDATKLAKGKKKTGSGDAPTKANAPVAWTQWGGPHRDFVSGATGLANQWPEEGPPKLWSRELGDGYSGILVEGDTLYTMYSVRDDKDKFKGQEFVVALNANTGKTKWEYPYDAPWPKYDDKEKQLQMEFGPGPHSTPIIAGDKLITVGTTAKMFCLNKKTGKVIWSHDLQEEYKAELMNRGYGSSPLVYEGNVILPIGGKGKALVAWNLEDGKEAWKGGDYDGTYSSLFPIKFAGEPQFVAFEAEEVVGLEPGSGKVKWSHPHKTQYGANISTPVYGDDGRIFISSAYGMGSRGVQLVSEGGKITTKELWYNPKMKIHHATAVRIGDVIYGSSGDFGPAFIAAVDLKTGEFLWKERGFSKANIIAADGKLIILDEDGNLAIGKATPEKFTLLSKFQPLKKTAWTVPTLSGTRLFIRDRKTIMALDLGVPEKAS